MRFILASGLLVIILSGCATAPPPAPPPCSAPAVPAAAADPVHTVFDIALGQALNLPECPKYRSGSLIRYSYSKEACWQRTVNPAECSPIADGYVDVEFPVLTLPYWTGTSRITVRVVGGRVEGARIDTIGIKGQEFALKALIEKYGEPSESFNTLVQNRMGAQYTSLNSKWKVSDVTILLFGTTGHLDEGQVEIATEIGAAAFKSDAVKLTEGVRPL